MIHKSVSPLGLQRIQSFEGFRAEPVQLPDGRWLYGFGHVATTAPETAPGRRLAAQILQLDLAPAERAVNAMVTREMTQSQFDALVSFAFSVGVSAFAKSDVLRRASQGQWAAAGCALDAWRKSSVSGESEVVEALVRRRALEKAMLVEQSGAAASAWLKPELDHAAAILAAPVRMPALPELAAEAPAAAAPLTLVHRIKPVADMASKARSAAISFRDKAFAGLRGLVPARGAAA